MPVTRHPPPLAVSWGDLPSTRDGQESGSSSTGARPAATAVPTLTLSLHTKLYMTIVNLPRTGRILPRRQWAVKSEAGLPVFVLIRMTILSSTRLSSGWPRLWWMASNSRGAAWVRWLARLSWVWSVRCWWGFWG